MTRLLILAFLALSAPAAAQAPAAPAPAKTPAKAASSAPRAFQQTRQPGDVEVDPIKCFWKTDRSTIIVGERFTVVLTCGIIETDKIKARSEERRVGKERRCRSRRDRQEK